MYRVVLVQVSYFCFRTYEFVDIEKKKKKEYEDTYGDSIPTGHTT